MRRHDQHRRNRIGRLTGSSRRSRSTGTRRTTAPMRVMMLQQQPGMVRMRMVHVQHAMRAVHRRVVAVRVRHVVVAQQRGLVVEGRQGGGGAGWGAGGRGWQRRLGRVHVGGGGGGGGGVRCWCGWWGCGWCGWV